jgi:hypothetical protein
MPTGEAKVHFRLQLAEPVRNLALCDLNFGCTLEITVRHLGVEIEI